MPLIDSPAFTIGRLGLLMVSSDTGRFFSDDAGALASSEKLELDFRGWAHSGRWAVQLDTALGRGGDRMLVVAQGLACLAVAWWAQLSPKAYLERMGGALFVSPLSFSPSEAPIARSLRPSPGTRLPFPSIVTSGASPIIGQVLDLADIWGSQFIDTDASSSATRRALQAHPLARQPALWDVIAASPPGRGGSIPIGVPPSPESFLLTPAGE